MKNVQIGIIGGTGGMGRWFAEYLKKEGLTVHVSGRTSGLNYAEMAKQCRVVAVSVPMGATEEIITQIGPLMKKDSLLMDLTSLKADPVKTMLATSHAEVIGCHPLFGPQETQIEGKNVVLCPARGEAWIPWLKEILEKNGARVSMTTPERHDQIMAVIQGLNHLSSIIMGLVMERSGISMKELEAYSTPFFETKLALIKKIFTTNPWLYADLVTLNPEFRDTLAIYEKTLADVSDLVYEWDGQGLTDLMKKAAPFFVA